MSKAGFKKTIDNQFWHRYEDTVVCGNKHLGKGKGAISWLLRLLSLYRNRCQKS